MENIKIHPMLNLLEKLDIDFNAHKSIGEEEREVECPEHGKYKAMFSLCDDGSAFQLTCCPKCYEEKERQIAEQEEKEREERELAHKRWQIETWTESHIRPEFFEKSLSDYIPKTEGQKRALKAAEDMIETRKGKIILLGSNGVGKTMLGSMIAKTIGGKIMTMYEITTLIRQSYSPKAVKSELEIVDELATVPFLCIDEVGRTKNSEAVQDWFSYILDKRHSSGLPFMLIGNLHFKKDCKEGGCSKCFENYFDSDILSRLHEDTTIIVLKADDNRRLSNTLTYFSD